MAASASAQPVDESAANGRSRRRRSRVAPPASAASASCCKPPAQFSPNTAAAKSSSAAALALSCWIKVLSTLCAQESSPQRGATARCRLRRRREKTVAVQRELLPISESRNPRAVNRRGKSRRDCTKPVDSFASLLELSALCIGRRQEAVSRGPAGKFFQGGEQRLDCRGISPAEEMGGANAR